MSFNYNLNLFKHIIMNECYYKLYYSYIPFIKQEYNYGIDYIYSVINNLLNNSSGAGGVGGGRGTNKTKLLTNYANKSVISYTECVDNEFNQREYYYNSNIFN